MLYIFIYIYIYFLYKYKIMAGMIQKGLNNLNFIVVPFAKGKTNMLKIG